VAIGREVLAKQLRGLVEVDGRVDVANAQQAVEGWWPPRHVLDLQDSGDARAGEEVMELWKKWGHLFLHVISYGWLSKAHPDPELFQ